jgi:hypothetical protein
MINVDGSSHTRASATTSTRIGAPLATFSEAVTQGKVFQGEVACGSYVKEAKLATVARNLLTVALNHNLAGDGRQARRAESGVVYAREPKITAVEELNRVKAGVRVRAVDGIYQLARVVSSEHGQKPAFLQGLKLQLPQPVAAIGPERSKPLPTRRNPLA